MRSFEECSIAEALSAWGHHEAGSRRKAQLPPDLDLSDPTACVSVALQFRPMFIARILASEPIVTLRGLIPAAEIASLALADGTTVPEWIASNARNGGEGLRSVQAMAESATRLHGALIVAAQLLSEEPEVVTGPKYLYDGWHRAAAWLERSKRGLDEDVPIYLILTKQQDPVRRGGS